MTIYINPKYHNFMVTPAGEVVFKKATSWYSTKMTKNGISKHKCLIFYHYYDLQEKKDKAEELKNKLDTWYKNGEMLMYFPDQGEQILTK